MYASGSACFGVYMQVGLHVLASVCRVDGNATDLDLCLQLNEPYFGIIAVEKSMFVETLCVVLHVLHVC